MRKITILLVLFNFTFVFAQVSIDYKQHILNANEFYKSKKFANSLSSYIKAFEIDNTKTNDLYNAACSAALSGQISNALYLLDLAIQNGYHNREHMMKDSDLDILKDTKEWNTLIEAIEKSKNSDEVLNRIIQLVSENNYLEIWELCGKQYKINTDKETFKTKINLIYQVSQGKHIKLISKSHQQAYTTVKPYKETLNDKAEFCIIPLITSKGNTEKYFNYKDYRPGDKLNLKLFKHKNNWMISELDYFPKQIKDQSVLKQHFISFFSLKDSLTYTYSLHKGKNEIPFKTTKKLSEDDSKDIENNILSIFKNARPLTKGKIFSSKKDVISITLLKKDSTKIGFFGNSNPNVMQIIYLKKSKMILLGNDKYDYGIFQLPKNDIFKELREMAVSSEK